MNLGLQLALGGLRKRGSVADAPILRTYDYAPAWESVYFNKPATDSNDRSIVYPSLSSRIVYVDTVNGDDATATIYNVNSYANAYAPSGEKAFKTFQAALDNTRSGYDDFILIKRGSSDALTSYASLKSGTSANLRAVIDSYGTGDRPKINSNIATLDPAFRIWTNVSYIFIRDIDFINTRRDPDSPDFVGFDNLTENSGAITIFNGGTHISRDIVIENCRARHYNKMVANSYSEYGQTLGLIVRHCTARDMYKAGGGGHPQGMYFARASVLVEDCKYIDCGYIDGVGTTSPITGYSHTIYSADMWRSIYRRLISIEPSSIHLKFTANPIYHDLANDLIGTETVVELTKPIDTRLYASGQIQVLKDGGNPNNDADYLTLNYTSYSGSQFTIEPYDFTSTPVTNSYRTVRYTQNMVMSDNVSVYDCIFDGGDVGVSFGGNDDAGDNEPRFESYDVSGNCFVKIGRYYPSGRELGWGAEAKDNLNSRLSENLFIGTDNLAVTNKYAIAVSGYRSGVSVLNNMSVNGAGTIAEGDADVYSNAEDIAETNFVNFGRDLSTYAAAVGFTDKDGLKEALFNHDTINPDARLSAKAISDYLRRGYAVKQPVVTTEPQDAVINIGETATYVFDAISNQRGLTYQWYNNDVLLDGETDKTLDVIGSTLNDGKNYKCIGTTPDGEAISRLANLFVFNAQPKLEIIYPDEVVFNFNGASSISIGPGQGIRFKFRIAQSAQTIPFIRQNDFNYIDLINNGSDIRVRKNVGIWNVNISSASVNAGKVHTFEYRVEHPNEPMVFNIDGNEYIGTNTSATSSSLILSKLLGSSSYPSGSKFMWDIEVFDTDDSILYAFAINSGEFDGGVEAAVIGTGTATMNVDEESWI